MSQGAVAERERERHADGQGRHAVARNFAHLFLGQVGTTALGIFLSAMLSRKLTVAEYGDYNVFLANFMLASVVVDWGQQQYLMREIALRWERTGALLGGALALRSAGSVLAALAMAAGTSFLYTPRTCLLGVLFLLTMVPFFLAQAYGFAFKGRERMENDALVQVLNKGLTLAFTVLALVAGWSLPGAILAQLAAGTGALVVAVALARRAQMPAGRPSRAVMRELLLGGAPIVVMYLAHYAQTTIDYNILKALVPPDVVGWFGAAKNILGTLIAPALIIGGATFPRLSRAASDRAQFRAELGAAMRPVLLMAGYAAVGTFICAHLAVDLICGADRFDAAGGVLQVSAPSFFLFFVDVLLGSAIIASGRSISMAVAKVVNVLASTLLDLWLIPLFQTRYGNGGLGAAIAYGASEVIMFAAALSIIPRGSLSARFAIDFGRALLAAAGAVVIVLLVRPLSWDMSGSSGWLSTVAALALGTAVFAGLAWATRLVTRADIQLIGELVRRRKA